MPPFVILGSKDRRSRRTIADCLEVVSGHVDLSTLDEIKLQIGSLRLPSGQIVDLSLVRFHAHDAIYVVSLPSSTEFTALPEGGHQRERFNITQLHGSAVDAQGNVSLAKGGILRAVEVIPTPLPLKPTNLDWRIIHATLSVIEGAAEICYRHFTSGLPAPYCDMEWPPLLAIDCAKLPFVPALKLNEILYRLCKLDKSFAQISSQKIADTIRKFGIPIAPTRVRKHSAAAI